MIRTLDFYVGLNKYRLGRRVYAYFDVSIVSF